MLLVKFREEVLVITTVTAVLLHLCFIDTGAACSVVSTE